MPRNLDQGILKLGEGAEREQVSEVIPETEAEEGLSALDVAAIAVCPGAYVGRLAVEELAEGVNNEESDLMKVLQQDPEEQVRRLISELNGQFNNHFQNELEPEERLEVIAHVNTVVDDAGALWFSPVPEDTSFWDTVRDVDNSVLGRMGNFIEVRERRDTVRQVYLALLEAGEVSRNDDAQTVATEILLRLEGKHGEVEAREEEIMRIRATRNRQERIANLEPGNFNNFLEHEVNNGLEVKDLQHVMSLLENHLAGDGELTEDRMSEILAAARGSIEVPVNPVSEQDLRNDETRWHVRNVAQQMIYLGLFPEDGSPELLTSRIASMITDPGFDDLGSRE